MKQRGFTILEISIVLIIAGLLLAGIVGGQSMIRSAQAKDCAAIIDDLRTATTYFKQRYGYLPGDWIYVANEIPNVTAGGTGGTTGNGLIEGTVNATGQAVSGTEVAEAPWQLYNASFLGKIDSSDTQRRIKTVFGAVHIINVANAGVAAYAGANPTVRNVIILLNLPCEIVYELDTKLDNGDYLSGKAIGNACANGVVDRYAVAL